MRPFAGVLLLCFSALVLLDQCAAQSYFEYAFPEFPVSCSQNSYCPGQWLKFSNPQGVSKFWVGTFSYQVPSNGLTITGVQFSVNGYAVGGWSRFQVYNNASMTSITPKYNLNLTPGSSSGTYSVTNSNPQDLIVGGPLVIQSQNVVLLDMWYLYPADRITVNSFQAVLTVSDGSSISVSISSGVHPADSAYFAYAYPELPLTCHQDRFCAGQWVPFSNPEGVSKFIVGTFTYQVPSSGLSISSVQFSVSGSASGGWARLQVYSPDLLSTGPPNYNLDLSVGVPTSTYSVTANNPTNLITGAPLVINSEDVVLVDLWYLWPADTITVSAFTATFNYPGGSTVVSI